MDFYTAVLRKSGRDWVALCLENGLVGQGDSKELAVTKLKEALVFPSAFILWPFAFFSPLFSQRSLRSLRETFVLCSLFLHFPSSDGSLVPKRPLLNEK